MGRTRPSTDSFVTLGYPGITLHARFRSTRVSLDLSTNSPDCYFAVYIDGKPQSILRPEKGRHELVLCDGLPDDEHTIRLVAALSRGKGSLRSDR
jgi:hypothetical protein